MLKNDKVTILFWILMRITDRLNFKVSLRLKKKKSEFIVLLFFATDYYVINNTRNIHVKWWKEGTISRNEFPRRKEREIYSLSTAHFRIKAGSAATNFPRDNARTRVHQNSGIPKFFQRRSSAATIARYSSSTRNINST